MNRLAIALAALAAVGLATSVALAQSPNGVAVAYPIPGPTTTARPTVNPGDRVLLLVDVSDRSVDRIANAVATKIAQR